MLWFPLTLFCALSLATADMFSKKALKYSSEYTVSFIRFVSCLPPLYILLYINGIPEISKGFYVFMAISVPLEIIAMVLYNRAIKLSPISLTLPLLSFTPIFLIFTAYAIIGEKPNAYGFIGIVLIAIGGYLLNVDSKKGVLHPFRAVITEKGSFLMLIVALLYSFTSVLGKVMVEKSDFFFAPAVYFSFTTLLSAALMKRKIKGSVLKGLPPEKKKLLLLTGVFSSLMIISHFMAISMVKAEYMISVKRISMLFGVIYGGLVFREVDIKKRLLSTTIMLIGIAVIGILGR